MNPFRSTRDDNIVSLTADSNHKWIQTRSKRLFVPSCYDDIWRLCETNLAVVDGVEVCGTPGVGKSCFLDFALHKLLADEKSVMYVHGKSSKVYFYKSDGNVEEYTVADAINSNLAETVDFVLLDPPEGGDPNFWGNANLHSKKFILAVSPDRNNCRGLRKDASTVVLYMGPVQSIEVAQEMRAACYPAVAEHIVAARFQEFGGISRFLFKPYDPNIADLNKRERDDQRQALNDVVAHPRGIDSGEPASGFKSLWTLYQIHPLIEENSGTIDYGDYTIHPCCEDARARIRDKLMEKSVSDLWMVFFETDDRLGALKGIRFEAYAHKKILVEGLTCSATRLTQNGLSTAPAVPVAVPGFSTKVELVNNDVGQGLATAVVRARAGTSTTGYYLLPHFSNFPVVDSIFIPSGGGEAIQLQMKAGKSKPLSADKADAIITATSNTRLFFIVPNVVTMTKKLAGSNMVQYRVVLNEE
jgi:hypothetical protein